MKRFSFILMLVLGSMVSLAQELDEINEMMGKSQYRKAKDAIDKLLSNQKNAGKADVWYFKGRIYNALSRTDTTLAVDDVIKYKMEAFDAFKKYQQLDNKDLRFKLENYLSYFDIYNGLFDQGAKAFNMKNYDVAYNSFKNALLVEDYVRAKDYSTNGFKFPVLDTSLVLNTAIAAKQAKKEEEALPYYMMLANANLTADNYKEIYEYLAEYYSKKKDMAAFNAILDKGKKMFPNDSYWESMDIDQAIAGLSKDDLFKKYEELMVKYPNSFVTAYNYSVELYKFIYADENKALAMAPYKAKFVTALKKAITINPTAEDNFLLANYLYNNSFDITDEARKIKGTKPDDAKKKAELNEAAKKSLSECIPYAETAAELFSKKTKLKAIEKANYKQTLDILIEAYRVKGDAKKMADYKAKKEAVDKM